jgi:pimeloyl-ACP methyl ester carboxylesterase
MGDHYVWPGGREKILRFGSPAGPQILFVQPFFEEANRLRQIITSVMRALAAEGIGCSLPDLPGVGESSIRLETVLLADWRVALAAAAQVIRAPEQPLLIASFRGGALIDDAAGGDHVWRCAPETGGRLVRDLMRTKLAGGGDAADDTQEVMALAGNCLRKTFLDEIALATPASIPKLRTVRLATDAAPADATIPGGPVWRRSEPGDDPDLRAAIFTELLTLTRSCASS